MFCQKSIHLAEKLRGLTVCQPLSATILKSNIYNDSMERPLVSSKRKIKELNENMNKDNEPYSIMTLIFGKSKEPKKDIFEDFRRVEFAPDILTKYWREQGKELELISQEFIEKRHKILGSDLAAASFIINVGGKALFKGHKEWMELDKDGNTNLPKLFDPNYVLVGLDCSGINLYYEGLQNLVNLTKLKWLSFRGNKYLDDWSLDKISAEFPTVEHLDISECEKLTERGIESLYKMSNLKKVLITDYNNSPALELTLFMLQDCNPDLEYEILKPPVKKDESKNSDDSV